MLFNFQSNRVHNSFLLMFLISLVESFSLLQFSKIVLSYGSDDMKIFIGD